MTVFGYIRVSTVRQVEHGLSLEAQRQQIAGYAAARDFGQVTWLQDEGVSGSTELVSRKAGSMLLGCASKGDVVICAKLDRMFRSALDALNMLSKFKEMGVSLHFMDLGGDVTNGIGQLVFTILSAVAEQERQRIRERISDVKLTMRQQHRYQGGKVAFGYSVGKQGELITDKRQQRCIAVMRQKREEGMSLRAISRIIAVEYGVKISHNAVAELLAGKRKTDLQRE